MCLQANVQRITLITLYKSAQFSGCANGTSLCVKLLSTRPRKSAHTLTPTLLLAKACVVGKGSSAKRRRQTLI